ncbi:MAG: ATP-binding protein [Deltaproteobacteria bacterium]|nr:ATP-binding protein [Deltaproteobacteria bacterium]
MNGTSPQIGPYVFGLEHVPLPAVACDGDRRILWYNARFSEACGLAAIPRTVRLEQIADLTGEKRERWPALEPLANREIAPIEVLLGGEAYTLHVGKVGLSFGCVFVPGRDAQRSSMTSATPEEEPGRSPPTGHQLLEAFIALSREINVNMREEEIVHLFAETFERLFPGRLLAIRIVDPATLALSSVYASGRLRNEARDSIAVTETASRYHGLTRGPAALFFTTGRIRSTKTYEPVFDKGRTGFEVPLYDGKSFYGLVNLEYDDENPPLTADRPLMEPLALLMCTALRNAGLVAETFLLKDYLEKLLDRANAPVIVVDRERRITVVNQALERLTGYDRRDIVGAELLTLVPDSEQARLLPAALNALRGEPTSNIELRIPRADGTGFAHVAFNTASILTAFGEVEGVIFVGQDLTEVRALQKQVIHSEKLATLGQVAAGVAHELNNPLTSISVYASYLAKKLEGRVEESDLARLNRIIEGAARIQSFTKALVTYARPSGEEPVLVRVGELLERALSFCEHIVHEAKADVTLDVAADLGPIYGIRGQMEQVFVNLLTNACHALMPDGGRIAIKAASFGEDRIEVSVSDTGHGIPPENREAVFEPFFTTKKEGHGTGLGLSIVRNILVNHNAEILLESEVGVGTTFRIRMYTA